MLAAVLAALLLPTSALADEPANPLERNEPRPVGQQGQAAQVPEWVVPGARVTYYGSSSTTPKNQPQGGRVRGSGANSYTQYDIVAVTAEGVLIEARSYMVYEQGGAPMLADVTKVMRDTATGGGLWMTPAAIAASQPSTDRNANPLITHGPQEIGGDTYDTISIQTKSADGTSTTQQVFDRATGLALYHSDLLDNRQVRTQGFSEFRSYRVAELPWQGTAYSEQMQGFTKLAFAGAMVLVAPPTPGGLEPMPDTRMAFETEFTFTSASDQMIAMTIRSRVPSAGANNQPPEQREVMSPGQRMGLYIDPAVLSQLEDGQTLDEDRTVGYTIRVTDLYRVDGVTLVEITEQGTRNGYTLTATYDASCGLQVAAKWTQPAMSQVLESVLERVE